MRVKPPLPNKTIAVRMRDRLWSKPNNPWSAWRNYSTTYDKYGAASRTLPTKGVHHRYKGGWLSLPYTASYHEAQRETPGNLYVKDGGWYEHYSPLPVVTSFWQLGIGSLAEGSSIFNELTPRVRLECSLAMRSAHSSSSSRKDEGPSVNAGVALAESRESVEMIVNRAEMLGKAIVYMSQGRYRKAAESLGIWRRGFAPGGWLELSYGWRPLMDDIYNAFQTLKTGFAQKDQVLSVSRSASCSFDKGVTYPSSVVPSQVYTLKRTYRSRATLVARVSDPRLHTLASLGLANPYEIIWERVPFSFVVDWFLPVGQLVAQLSTSFGLDFVDGSTTQSVTYSYVGQCPDTSQSISGTNRTLERCSASIQGIEMKRFVDTGWWLTGLYFVSNPFKSNVRKANAIALSVQSLQRWRT